MHYTPFLVWPAPLDEGGGGGGVTVHNLLTGRSVADQHPMSAITGLVAALAAAAGGAPEAITAYGAPVDSSGDPADPLVATHVTADAGVTLYELQAGERVLFQVTGVGSVVNIYSVTSPGTNVVDVALSSGDLAAVTAVSGQTADFGYGPTNLVGMLIAAMDVGGTLYPGLSAGPSIAGLQAHSASSGPPHPQLGLSVQSILGVSDVDGTATSFAILTYHPLASEGGDVPDGWTPVFTVPDVATLQWLLGSLSITVWDVLVPAGANKGVYRVPVDGLTSPWPKLTMAPNAQVLAETPNTTRLSPLMFVPAEDEWLPVASLYRGYGLLTGIHDTESAISELGGIADTEHWIAAVTDAEITLATYTDSDVGTQPTLGYGSQPVPGSAVLVKDQSTATENGVYTVSTVNGRWTRINHPSILIGNRWTCMLNAPGTKYHGKHWEWLDNDRTIQRRRSIASPGSSDGESDFSGGTLIFSDAFDVETPGDWDATPESVTDALNELASRLTAVEP